MKFKMSQMDELKITVLVENSVPYRSQLAGAAGVSYLLEAKKQDNTVKIMVDTGREPDILLKNMDVLKIDPGEIDIVALTHCHFDHTQGLAFVLSKIGKKNIPVVIHPSFLRVHFGTRPYLRHHGIMKEDRQEEIEKNGGTLFLTREPLELMEGLITSGEINKETDFEVPDKLRYTLDNGLLQLDEVKDELSLIANVAGKGLVIITGCSHRGIVNICRQAVKLTGIEQIEGILGGFHLVNAGPDKIAKTVESLKELNPNWISAGHCTGFEAEVALKNCFLEKYTHLTTGNVYHIKRP